MWTQKPWGNKLESSASITYVVTLQKSTSIFDFDTHKILNFSAISYFSYLFTIITGLKNTSFPKLAQQVLRYRQNWVHWYVFTATFYSSKQLKIIHLGTSNWSEDYFTRTAGISLAFEPIEMNHGGLHADLLSVFLRDWNSVFCTELSYSWNHWLNSFLPVTFDEFFLLSFRPRNSKNVDENQIERKKSWNYQAKSA